MIYKYLYLLAKQLVTASVPQVREFDWYHMQGTPQYQGGVRTPVGVYLRVSPTDMRDLANGVQEGVVQFDLITVVDNRREGDQRISPATGLDAMGIANQVHLAIFGKSGKLSDLPAFAALAGTPQDYMVMNTVTRTRVETDHQNKGLFKTTQTYRSYVKDLSGWKPYQHLITTLQIDVFELM